MEGGRGNEKKGISLFHMVQNVGEIGVKFWIYLLSHMLILLPILSLV